MTSLLLVLALLSTPNATIDAFLTALNDADPKIVELFADDATVFFPMNDRPLRASGRVEIDAAFQSLFAGAKPGKGMPAPENLQVQTIGDVTIVTFQTVNPNVTSRRTFVLRREGRQWRIVHLHGSNTRKD
jgi:ketosteroid isomerase-like protein